MIALGVLVPLDVPGADFVNFVGYVLWSFWLLAFAMLIWRRPERLAEDGAPASAATAAPPISPAATPAA
jgi:hypothetical protein